MATKKKATARKKTITWKTIKIKNAKDQVICTAKVSATSAKILTRDKYVIAAINEHDWLESVPATDPNQLPLL